jgi:hypothetical protein
VKVLLYVSGSGVDVAALRVPVSILKAANPGLRIDVMCPRAHQGELAGHPDIRSLLHNSDFNISDSHQVRKMPRRVLDGLSRSYAKILDCSLGVSFPSVPGSVAVSAKEELYCKIFNKHGFDTSVAKRQSEKTVLSVAASDTGPPDPAQDLKDPAVAPSSGELVVAPESRVRDLYVNLDDRDFIARQFWDFYNRSPSESELNNNLRNLDGRSRQQLNDDLAYGEGPYRRARQFSFPPALSSNACNYSGSARVAVLLCGHLRTFRKTYPVIRKNLVLPMNADVFVHTWDTLGMQIVDSKYGPIPDDSQRTDAAEVYRLIPEIADLRMESNAAFIARAKVADSKPYVFGQGSGGGRWKMLSAKPVFIESQLYSLDAAFRLLQQHEVKVGKKYDVIIKLRSDMQVENYSINSDDIRDSDIVIPSPPNNNHGHPTCFACERGSHEGRHAADVCDVYAYGGRDGMGHYCSLWSNLDSVYNRMCQENEVNIKNPLALHGMVDGHVTVPIWHNAETHRLHCFYPERLFRIYLEGWHLKKGTVTCKVVR